MILTLLRSCSLTWEWDISFAALVIPKFHGNSSQMHLNSHEAASQLLVTNMPWQCFSISGLQANPHSLDLQRKLRMRNAILLFQGWQPRIRILPLNRKGSSSVHSLPILTIATQQFWLLLKPYEHQSHILSNLLLDSIVPDGPTLSRQNHLTISCLLPLLRKPYQQKQHSRFLRMR